MEDYGIPVSVEMMTRLMRCIAKDIQKSSRNKSTYKFTLMAQEV